MKQTWQAQTQHMTPPALAVQVVHPAIDPLVELGMPPEQIRVLDPACGDGELLLAAMRRLVHHHMRIHGSTRREAVDRCAGSCHGTDLDPTLVSTTAIRFLEEFGFEPELCVQDALVDDVEDWEPHVCVLNPPYIGGKKISGLFGKEYAEWIKSCYGWWSEIDGEAEVKHTEGTADIAAYFLRRAAEYLMPMAATRPVTMGILATNTLAQGGTMRVGLGHLCAVNGWQVYECSDNIPWPGKAAVTVRTAHLSYGHVGRPPIGRGKMYNMVRLRK